MTNYQIKRSYRGETLVVPEGAPPVTGEWKTAKNGKSYFATTRKDILKYGRASDAGKHLKGGSGLADFKGAFAAMGIVQSAKARSQVATLINEYDGDPYYKGNDGGTQSGKSRLMQAVEFACDVAGASDAAERGTEFHQLWEQRNRGQQPRIVQPHLVGPLERYCEQTGRIKFIGSEFTIVNDELQRAGTCDHLLVVPKGSQGPDGNPLPEDWVVVGDGKGLPLDTKIPTPTGWTTMGELQPGDQVFSSNGEVCNVTLKSSVKNIGTWVVHFDDGSQVVCDTEHLWWTMSGMSHDMKESVLPIGEIVKTVTDSKGRPQHRIPVAQALRLPDANLPIAPYVLGAWLGDGNRGRGVITNEQAFFDVLEADGYKLGVSYADKRSGILTRTVIGLMPKLRQADLLSNKHVPDVYLRASYEQRLQLVQGLMDTDGSWNIARNMAEFVSTNKGLALAVEELLLTLGQRPYLSSRLMSGFGKTVTGYEISFTPVGINPFRLPRKRDKCAASTKNVTKSTRRLITSVTRGPDVSTVCIAVDSPNRTYLCTEKFIPTHNTGRWDVAYPAGVYAQVATYALGQLYDQDTNTRSPIHPDLNTDWGVLIHFPLHEDEPNVGLYWLDLNVGKAAAILNNRLDAMSKHFQSVDGKPKKFELA